MKQVITGDPEERRAFDAIRQELEQLAYDVYLRFGKPVTIIGTHASVSFDTINICNPTSAAIKLSLPKLTANDAGKVISIKNHSASTNSISAFAAGGDNIDGDDSFTMTTAWSSRFIIALTATDWGVF